MALCWSGSRIDEEKCKDLRLFWRHLVALVMKGEFLWGIGQDSSCISDVAVCVVGCEMGNMLEGGLSSVCV